MSEQGAESREEKAADRCGWFACEVMVYEHRTFLLLVFFEGEEFEGIGINQCSMAFADAGAIAEEGKVGCAVKAEVTPLEVLVARSDMQQRICGSGCIGIELDDGEVLQVIRE